MAYLTFMSDEHLLNCIKFLYEKYEKAKSEFTIADFYSNQIDPIKLLFDIKFFGISEKEKITQEINRQIDKAISNHIGTFHELLIGGIDGYSARPVGDGYDITDDKCEKLFADIKNKHNTVTGTHLYNLYVKVESFLTNKTNAKAYYVQVITSNGKTKDDSNNWVLSMKKHPISGIKFVDENGNNISKVVKNNPDVFLVSIDRFYEILTGNKNAFSELCSVLPKAIDDYLKDNSISTSSENSGIYKSINENCEKNNTSFITQLMNDTFTNYYGFPLKDNK